MCWIKRPHRGHTSTFPEARRDGAFTQPVVQRRRPRVPFAACRWAHFGLGHTGLHPSEPPGARELWVWLLVTPMDLVAIGTELLPNVVGEMMQVHVQCPRRLRQSMCCLYQLLAPCLGFNPYTKAPDAAPIQSSNSLSCPTMRSAAVDCGCTAFSPRGGSSSGSFT